MTNGRITITLNSELKTLRFNNYSREELGKMYNYKDALEGLRAFALELKSNSIRAISKLVYAGLVGAYEAQCKDIDFTREDVAEWVGDAVNADLGKVLDCWIDANQLREIIEVEKKREADQNAYRGMM